MCGLFGLIDYSSKIDEPSVRAMILAQKHRGPDAHGIDFWRNEGRTTWLAHSRLSIIDLSENANQPMSLGELSLVFNGEIYNYLEIKTELINTGCVFTTNSDTEVILHAYLVWGSSFINKLIGMFAIAILDKKKNRVLLYRDRLGVKPLYYGFVNGNFVFSSEIKSFLKVPNFCKVINEKSVQEFFLYSYISGESTIYKDIFKLRGGKILHFDIGTKDFNLESYWELADTYALQKKNHEEFTDSKVLLEELLRSSINYRMVSDVPVGVFLSSGVDSSLVSSVLSQDLGYKLKSFTIAYDNFIDESEQASKIAEYLGTEHYEFKMKSTDAMETISELSYYFDEPFADSSAIPTMFLSKRASEHVKVVLSGDGGDELFYGYNQFVIIDNYLRITNRIPYFFGFVLSPILILISSLFNKDSFKRRKYLILSKLFLKPIKTRTAYLYHSLFHASSPVLIKELLTKGQKLEFRESKSNQEFKSTSDELMFLATKHYLQDDLLKKVDISTMSASIEGREPLLDHRLVEFAADLSVKHKFNNGEKKSILKDLIKVKYKDLPVGKSKMGFTAPIYEWLKGDLKPLLESYTSVEELSKSGLLQPEKCRAYIDKFYSGKEVDETVIWKILVFQMWYKRWLCS